MSLSPDVPIVLVASAPYETPAPVNVHQIARRLAARGHRVLFVESTGLRAPAPVAASHDRLRILNRLRDSVRGVREVAPNLFVLSPLALPGAGPHWLRRASLAWIAILTARAARRLGMQAPVVWAFLPTALPLARRARARLLVYHCVDHYAENPGVDAAWIDQLEAEVLASADLVFATSPVLAERLSERREDVQLMANVADVELFSRARTEALVEPPELARAPRPRFVYIGNLAAYRVDPALLLALVRGAAPCSLVCVGAEGLGDVSGGDAAWTELLARSEVVRLGPRPQQELPAVLRHCDVALIPFLDNAHTRGSLPLKLFEYLAAGLPVVATDLPNLRSLAAEGWIRLAQGPEAFVRAALAALDDSEELAAGRAAMARRHAWPARMEALCGAVGSALEREPKPSFQKDSAPL